MESFGLSQLVGVCFDADVHWNLTAVPFLTVENMLCTVFWKGPRKRLGKQSSSGNMFKATPIASTVKWTLISDTTVKFIGFSL